MINANNHCMVAPSLSDIVEKDLLFINTLVVLLMTLIRMYYILHVILVNLLEYVLSFNVMNLNDKYFTYLYLAYNKLLKQHVTGPDALQPPREPDDNVS